MPRKIIVIDAETDPFRKGRVNIKPFIWGMYDGQTKTYFKDTNKIKELLEKENYVVYAHNGGKFDYHFLLDFVNPFEPIMVVNGRIAKMKIGACEFRDSYSIIPLPLAAYQKTKINYDIMEAGEREKPHNEREIIKYLGDDLEFTYDLIKSFTDEYGHNLTLASCAFKMWRKISGNKNPKTNRSFYDAIHPFYYGGRVQCFKMGEIKHDFSVYDVNSAYPSAMLHEHPYGDSYEISSRLPQKNVHLSFIRLKARSMGCFPYRTENGLYFPNDKERREFNITGYEYLKAKELGLIHDEKIIEVYTFSESINFKQYVNYFFKKKQNAEDKGDIIRRNEAKLFLNGLYGKFASDPSQYREFMPVPAQYIEGSGIEGWQFNSMFGKWALMNRPLPIEKQNYYNLATGASITGYQRAVMMEGISNVKDPLYCDTDSIVCRSAGSLRVGNNIGEWKKEAVCNYGAIAGKKLYAFQVKNKHGRKRFKIASKGVRLKPSEIIQVARGKEITAENIAPTFTIHKEPHLVKRKIIMRKELQNA